MRPCMIKVGDIGSEDSLKLPLIEYQQVIETFPSDTAQETFADGIRTRSMDRRSEHFDGTSPCDTGEAWSELAVVISNQIPWSLPIRRGFPKLLGHPGVGRRSCNSHMDDFARFQFDDEEDEERTKEQIGDLKEITGPDSFRMIAKKGRPGLPSWMQHTSLLHVLLDGSLTHANTQLEQFATNALSPPKLIVLGHLFD